MLEKRRQKNLYLEQKLKEDYMETKFIGIDLHKSTFTMAIKDQAGRFKVYKLDFTNDGIEKLKSLLSRVGYKI